MGARGERIRRDRHLTYNPKVASVLSYDRFTSYGLSEALPVAAVLVLFALVPLAALRALKMGAA